MKVKTQEFLLFLLWSYDMASRPTFRNLTDSFESWAYRNGLQRLVEDLERRKLLESQRGAKSSERLVRLTEAGRLRALGDRDPEKSWHRSWDGKWRLVMFDVPNERGVERRRLWYYLRQHRFGCLQKSVWISPDPLTEQQHALKASSPNAKMLTLLEATTCGGESAEDIVASAWDFNAINARYTDFMNVLEGRPSGAITNLVAANAMRKWASDEHAAWDLAVSIDPLLPQQLLPRDYLGVKAWQARLQSMSHAGKQIRAFKP
jgi:phenylacetic acid degradation operon negative regulatory protein